MPSPPPLRSLGLKISPQSKHQKTMNRLTFVREINASVAAALNNTNDRHPHPRHQSQPHEAMNTQGRQRGQEYETPAKSKKGRVENSPFTDDNGDVGMYTGETNEYGRPHGKGRMKYKNGVFFEGKWVNGTCANVMLDFPPQQHCQEC